jgi:hypothetical protein
MSAPDTGRQPDGHVKDLLTVGAVRACHYATGDARRAAARPDCDGLAAIVYGPIALCASCDLRRSAVGKGTAPRHLPDPVVLVALHPAHKTATDAADALADAVSAARAAGHTWAAIAAALGVSRQTAHQRFSQHRTRPSPS